MTALAIDIDIVHAIHRFVCLVVPSATVVFVFWWVGSFHPVSMVPWNSHMFGDRHPRRRRRGGRHPAAPTRRIVSK